MKDIISVNYLNDLGSSKAVPGGGSACCNVGIIAVALIMKSLKITKSRKSFDSKPVPVQNSINSAIYKLDAMRLEFETLEDKDIECFNKYMEAYKANNKRKMANSLVKCFDSAYSIYKFVYEAFKYCNELALNIVDSIKSDYYFGLRLLTECMENALNNMKENSKLINKKEYNEIVLGCEGNKTDISYIKRLLRVSL